MNSFHPSYAQGFARNAAESENPGLWQGLVGAWASSLGPTGATLRDQSGRGNHGTLTNMDPATDWVVGEKGWALDLVAASSQYIPVDSLVSSAWTYPYSIIGTFRTTSAAGQNILSLSILSTSNRHSYLGVVDGQVRAVSRNTAFSPAVGGSGLDDGEWHTVAGVWPNADLRIAYADGVQVATNTVTVTIPSWNVADIGCLSRDGVRCSAAAFDGQLGPVSIYSRALAPAEIQQLYVDPNALFQPRRLIFPAAVAAPSGNPYYAYAQQVA